MKNEAGVALRGNIKIRCKEKASKIRKREAAAAAAVAGAVVDFSPCVSSLSQLVRLRRR